MDRSARFDERYVVGSEALVGADDRQVLCTGLRDQKPVEGIAMVQRQICHRETMTRSETENAKAALYHVVVDVGRYRELANGRLDADLRKRHHAEQQLRSVLDRFSRRLLDGSRSL